MRVFQGKAIDDDARTVPAGRQGDHYTESSLVSPDTPMRPLEVGIPRSSAVLTYRTYLLYNTSILLIIVGEVL